MSFVRDEALELFAGTLNWLTADFAFVFTDDGYTADPAHTRLTDVPSGRRQLTVAVDSGKTVAAGFLNADDPADQTFPTAPTVAYSPATTVHAVDAVSESLVVSHTPVQDKDVLLIDSERLRVVRGGGTTLLTVDRGYQGTTAAAHLAGTAVVRVRAINGGWLYHDTGSAATSELLAWFDRTPGDVLIAFIPPFAPVQVIWPRGPLGAGFIKL